MAGGGSRRHAMPLEDRVARIEAGFKAMRDFALEFPVGAVENANTRQIVEFQSLVSTIREHVPDSIGSNDCGTSATRPLKLEDRIGVIETNLDRMREYLRSSPLEVIGAANATAVADLQRIVLQRKCDVERRVSAGPALSPYVCQCPNGFNAPRVTELVQEAGALLRKGDQLRRDIEQAIRECPERSALVTRLEKLIELEDADFDDYEPPIPSPYDGFTSDSDRSPKGVW